MLLNRNNNVILKKNIKKYHNGVIQMNNFYFINMYLIIRKRDGLENKRMKR
jgi:hypothetical protein